LKRWNGLPEFVKTDEEPKETNCRGKKGVWRKPKINKTKQNANSMKFRRSRGRKKKKKKNPKNCANVGAQDFGVGGGGRTGFAGRKRKRGTGGGQARKRIRGGGGCQCGPPGERRGGGKDPSGRASRKKEGGKDKHVECALPSKGLGGGKGRQSWQSILGGKTGGKKKNM